MMTFVVVLILIVQIALGFRIYSTRNDDWWPIAVAIVVLGLSLFWLDESFRETVAMVLPNVDKVRMTTVIVQVIAHLIGGALTVLFGRNTDPV